MERSAIRTSKAPAPIGPYEQAVVVGGLVFTSGQIGLDPATGEMVPGGVDAEARRVFTSLCAVLEAAGSSPRDVVKTTLYLRDLSDFGRVNAIYETFFGEAKPARTTVGVSALPRGAAIEADVVARVPS
jgi:2-iminobutanoate/2-iminopropanoate deaminase